MATVKPGNSTMADWSSKYFPRCLEDMILPPSIKRSLILIRDRQVGPHLLLHGPHGTGKTVAALLLQMTDQLRILACKPETNTNAISYIIHQESEDWENKVRRLIVLDNADQLKTDAQAEVRAFMDTNARRNMYVLTANNPNKLGSAILSCVVPVDFSQIRGDPELREGMQIRALGILEAEGIQADASIVKGIVNRWFPDMRQVVKTMQYKLGLAP
jgi:DNA polymerase III delta prime subunit